MSDTSTKQRTQTRIKTERPKLHKVILVNDDYTPREFVVKVLLSVFRMGDPQA
jgi:ATP-dependent Clp protease adaptor protein ClpS